MRMTGCRITWDIETARRMWVEGIKVKDIAAAVSTPKRSVSEESIHGAVYRYNWPLRGKPKAELNAKKAESLVIRCSGCWGHLAENEAHVCRQTRPRMPSEFAA